MNIIKEFEDHDFFCIEEASWPSVHQFYTWYWGLGDDGELYYRCTLYDIPDKWYSTNDNKDIMALIKLKTMKKIVKQFGHLLIFT